MQRVLKTGSGNKDVVPGIGEGLKRSGKSLAALNGRGDKRRH
jgi:hypothetical protein